MEERFGGKTAFVTGAGSGIGRAVAQRLGGEGAAVACVDIDGGTAEATAKGIAATGARAVPFTCDVASYAEGGIPDGIRQAFV